MSLSKVALVTGSGKRRIGWHVANALADRGYALAIHYHHSRDDALETVASLQKRGISAASFQADLTDDAAALGLVHAVLREFGRLDVLVNCAADWSSKPLEEVTAGDVRHFFEINTLATFLCSQHAGLAMVQQPEGGNIITVGDWATRRPYLNYAPYLVSKGSLPTLTRTLALELGSRNPKMRVNCILPGPVMLPPDLPADERREAIEGTILKSEGRPEHVAQTVLFLIDNDFMTGSCVTVDGGRSIFLPE